MKNTGAALVGLALALLLASCSPLALKEVQFGWPVESVLTVNDDDRIEDRRYNLTTDLAPLAAAEFNDSTALRGREVRLLRSQDGFYFLTGMGFRHVYVFAPGKGELKLESKIEVSSTGLKSPAMNQRPPYVELLDGKDMRLRLTHSEVVEEGGEE